MKLQLFIMKYRLSLMLYIVHIDYSVVENVKIQKFNNTLLDSWIDKS